MKKRTAEKGPLAGRRIVLTRTPEGNERFEARLADAGAEILQVPLIAIEGVLKPDGADEIFAQFGNYDWLVFTSASGVRHFMNVFLARFGDIRSLGLVRLVAIGKGTADALAVYHLQADLVPEKATAQGVFDALKEDDEIENRNFLMAVGTLNDPWLAEVLENAGGMVDRICVYSTRAVEPAGADWERFLREGADAIVFSSASAVKAYLAAGDRMKVSSKGCAPLFCSIGPVTTDALRCGGLAVQVQADEASPEGILDALVKRLASGAEPAPVPAPKAKGGRR